MLRVLICDDQHVVCEGLRAILSTAPQIEVVGLAYDGAEVVELAPGRVLLIDFNAGQGGFVFRR